MSVLLHKTALVNYPMATAVYRSKEGTWLLLGILNPSAEYNVNLALVRRKKVFYFVNLKSLR